MESETNEAFEQMLEACGGRERLAVDAFCQGMSPEQAKLELKESSRFSGTNFVQSQKLLEKQNLETNEGTPSGGKLDFMEAVEERMKAADCRRGQAIRFVISEQPALHAKFLLEKEDAAVSLRAAR